MQISSYRLTRESVNHPILGQLAVIDQLITSRHPSHLTPPLEANHRLFTLCSRGSDFGVSDPLHDSIFLCTHTPKTAETHAHDTDTLLRVMMLYCLKIVLQVTRRASYSFQGIPHHVVCSVQCLVCIVYCVLLYCVLRSMCSKYDLESSYQAHQLDVSISQIRQELYFQYFFLIQMTSYDGINDVFFRFFPNILIYNVNNYYLRHQIQTKKMLGKSRAKSM